jgi:hypothetical protein
MNNAHARLVLVYISALGALLLSLSFTSGDAAAESVEGTWTSRIAGEGYFDHTYPADFHYDVNLQLSASGSGTVSSTCSKVDVNVAGWESAKQAVGKTSRYSVSGSVSGSRYTMYVSGYSFPLTVSGGRMYGNGQYTDTSGTVNTWKYDLKGGGAFAFGDMAALSAAGAAVSGAGAAAGLAASLVPAPKPVLVRSPAPMQYPRAASGMNIMGPHHRPQGPLPYYGPFNPQPPVSYAPGDARIYEPEPFIPIGPDPALAQPIGGVGVTQGPPDKPPPPNPPRGDEGPNDNNPTCPICHMKTMPVQTRIGWRWFCRIHGLPWG